MLKIDQHTVNLGARVRCLRFMGHSVERERIGWQKWPVLTRTEVRLLGACTSTASAIAAANRLRSSRQLNDGYYSKYCHEYVCLCVCLLVCLSDREDISGTTSAVFANFFVHVAHIRGSVLFRHDDRAHRLSAGRGWRVRTALAKCNLRLPCSLLLRHTQHKLDVHEDEKVNVTTV